MSKSTENWQTDSRGIRFVDILPLIVPAKRWNKNESECKDDQHPCAICGKGCNNETAHFYPFTHGATEHIVHPEDAEQASNENDTMGSYPIGPTCRRKLLQRFPFIKG